MIWTCNLCGWVMEHMYPDKLDDLADKHLILRHNVSSEYLIARKKDE